MILATDWRIQLQASRQSKEAVVAEGSTCHICATYSCIPSPRSRTCAQWFDQLLLPYTIDQPELTAHPDALAGRRAVFDTGRRSYTDQPEVA